MSNLQNPNFPEPRYQDKKEILKNLGRETYAISEGFPSPKPRPGRLTASTLPLHRHCQFTPLTSTRTPTPCASPSAPTVTAHSLKEIGRS